MSINGNWVGYWRFSRRRRVNIQSWRWRQHVPKRRSYLPKRLHDATIQNTNNKIENVLLLGGTRDKPVSTTALVLVTQFSNSFFRVIPVYYFKLSHKWLLLNPYLITLPETLDFVYAFVFAVAVRHTGLNLYLREQQGVTFCNFCWNVGKPIPRGVSSQANLYWIFTTLCQ